MASEGGDVELETVETKNKNDDGVELKYNDADDASDREDEDGVIDNLQNTVDAIRNSKYTKGECLCFFSFLIVFTIMVILGRGTGDVAFTQTVTLRNSLIERDLFIPWNNRGEKAFNDASTIEDIYRYIQDVALPFLLNAEDDYYIQSQQALLGGLRLKQLRYGEINCSKITFSRCWSSDWYRNPITFENKTYEYMDSSKLQDQSWRAKYGSYPGGGYIVDLPMDYNLSQEMISDLRDIKWIDGGTRYVGIDFNTYNPSTSLHTISRLSWEMPTSGVFPNDEIKTWKFERYSGIDGKFLMVFHILFLIYVIGLSSMMFASCYKEGCRKCGGKNTYWNSKWKALDAINLIIFYITILLFIFNETYRISNDIDLFSQSEFISFRKLQYFHTLESYTKAVNGCLLWIKLFKYLAINKRLRFLFTMLGRSGIDILMFIIVLSVFVVAFGTAGFITFNSDVDDFRSYIFSMSNMIRYILVELDYEALTVSSRVWGSAFYFFWSLLMLLVLVNVFIAILTESYSQVQMELSPEDKLDLNFLGMGKAFKSLRETITNKINATVTHDEFDGDGDGKVSAQELADQTGVSLNKAKEIIAKHDIDGDGELDQEEFENLKKQIISDQLAMEAQAQQEELIIENMNNNNNKSNISNKEFNKLKNEMNEIMELLTAVLDQTPAGKRALKQREFEKKNGKENDKDKDKAKRKSSRARKSSKLKK